MKMENENEFRQYSETLTVQELEHKLESARYMFMKAVVKQDPLSEQYLDVYKLASDVYYARKWNSE